MTYDTALAAADLAKRGMRPDDALALAIFVHAREGTYDEKYVTETQMKLAIADAKTDVMKWVVGLLLGQVAVIAALVKLLSHVP